MPKIETYTGSGGIVNLPRSSASDFVDTKGLEKISSSLSDMSERIAKMREVDDKLSIAREIAEGKQKWMIELDDRQRKVESGELSSTGFTENFNKDYAKWADEISGKYTGRLGQELRVNLTELQNPLMGGAMNFEASQRAKMMVNKYNETLNSSIMAVKNAKTYNELPAATIGIDLTGSAMPPDLQSKFKKDTNLMIAEREIELSDDQSQIESAINRISGHRSEMSPSETEAFMNKANAQLQFLQNKNATKLTEYMKASYESATDGSLPDGWKDEASIMMQKAPPQDMEKIADTIKKIEQVNETAKAIWEMTPADVSKLISGKTEEANKETDSIKREGIKSEIALYQKIAMDKNESLTKDFATTALKRSTTVGYLFDEYQNAIRQDDHTPESTKNIRDKFEKYVSGVDAYASKIKFTGFVKYLSEPEVDSIVQNVKTALSSKDGLKRTADIISSYENIYGSRFVSIMSQVREKDKSLGALTVVARIRQNVSVQSATAAKNEIVKALNIPLVDPNAYNGADVYKTPNTNQAAMSAALVSAGMADENQDRRNAYENLAKMYYKQGKEMADAQKAAYGIAYGDILVRNRLVYPASKKNSIGIIVNGANRLLAQGASELNMPFGSNESETKKIQSNPSDYIEYITSQDGSGLTAVWKYFGDGTEPVTTKSGGPILIKWETAEQSGILPYTNVYSVMR